MQSLSSFQPPWSKRLPIAKILAQNAGEDVVEQIAQWLEHRREQYLATANQENIPSSIQITKPVVENITDNGYVSHDETIATTPLASPVLSISLQSKIVHNPTVIQDSPAPRLYATYADQCKVWSPSFGANVESDPTGRIYRVLISRVLSEYLSALFFWKSVIPN